MTKFLGQPPHLTTRMRMTATTKLSIAFVLLLLGVMGLSVLEKKYVAHAEPPHNLDIHVYRTPYHCIFVFESWSKSLAVAVTGTDGNCHTIQRVE